MQPQPQPSPAQPADHDLHQMLVENETRRLLVHLDSQEAGMLAIRSLLTDMASNNLSTADRRRLKTRLDAATQLTQKLNAERGQILAEIASHVPGLTVELRLSELAAYVSKELRPPIAAARQRLSHLATQLSRQSATVRLEPHGC